MAESLRLYFLAFYGAGLIVLIVKVVPGIRDSAPVQYRVADWRRYLPAIAIPVQWLLPPIAILLRLGELEQPWPGLRLAGFALSLYAVVMLIWTPVTLGRFLVPKAVVFQNHSLVTSGPYRLVRHPLYSANLALILGSAFGTLNVCVLALWLLTVLSLHIEARLEEGLLMSKFGDGYRSYAARTPRFVPVMRGRR